MANIPTAKVFGGRITETIDGEVAADQRGFQARQHGASNRDVEVNNGARFIPGTDSAPPDVEGREQRENDHLNRMVQKINEIVGPTGNSSVEAEAALRRKFEAMGFGDIMDSPTGRAMNASVGGLDPFEEGRIKAAQQPRQQVNEDDLGVPDAAPPAKGNWAVDAMSAKTKSGASVPVWQVRDQRSGMKHPHPFRLAETAERVQLVLNRTGNVNDPRVQQWIEFDKRRQKLIGHIRQLREAVKAGNQQARGQLSEHQDILIEMDAKIGL